jgi:hypothetical protein
MEFINGNAQAVSSGPRPVRRRTMSDRRNRATNAGGTVADGIHGLAVAFCTEERSLEHVGDDSRKS